MERFRIYEDLEVSYKEVEDALIQLGFKNMSSANQFYFV
jgi:hypothetical protein